LKHLPGDLFGLYQNASGIMADNVRYEAAG